MNTLPPSVLPLLLALLFAGCRTAPMPQTTPAPGSAPEAAEANAAEEGGSVEDGACLPLPPDPALVARAEAGDAGAMAELGYHYSCGLANTVPEKAAYWFARAAEAGDSDAPFEIALLIQNGFLDSWEGRSLLDWVTLAATRGNAFATYNLALKYRFGLMGIPRDDVQAVRWFTVSAERDGDPEAMERLAEHYARGLGVPRRDDLAILWYRRAAIAGNICSKSYGALRRYGIKTFGTDPKDSDEARAIRAQARAGDPDAQFIIGRFYADAARSGYPDTRRYARHWLTRAARGGHPEAAAMLAHDTANDPAEHLAWLTLAAEAGHSESRYELACRLRDGDGAPQDLPRAYALFCALADGRGDLRAAGAAGLMAAAGEGIPADYAAACRLLTLGAKGNPTLYLPLALLHAEGRGTPRNPTLAYDMLAVCDLAFLGNPLRDTVSEIREALVETYPELKGRTPDLDAFDIFD